MLIDTHAHLDYPEFQPDFDAMLERAEAAGVTRLITIGTSVESSRRAVALGWTAGVAVVASFALMLINYFGPGLGG